VSEAAESSGEARVLLEAGERAISHLAHELRNPMSVIFGYAELLQFRDDEATRLEASTRIVQAADHLSQVIDDLLTVFAIDAGALHPEPVRVDLESLLSEIAARFEARSEQHSFSLSSLDGSWPRVSADGEQLTRVLTNLLLNACKHSPDGCNVRITVKREGGFASIAVTDDGPGLAPEQLAVVFDRFSGAAPPGHLEVRGSGLELYEVRRLVELHGGTISAESEPGRGSTFTFTLPLADEAAE
jgi:signal transduction histidine kinase